MKEIATAIVPIVPETFWLTFFPKKTLNKNPANGASSKVNSKLVSIGDYPFKFFNLSISIEWMFL
ncbi:hypothetical protein D3C80_1612460 [compost metagenome]